MKALLSVSQQNIILMTYVKFCGNSPFRPDPKSLPTPKKEKAKIATESKKRKSENKEYLALREVFLKGKKCPVTGKKATQVHHKKGRIGTLLMDVKYWLAVSAEGHKKIEENPEWAKEMGHSLNRL